MGNRNLKVGVIGIGYVGLVTATCLADLGREVICCDVNKEKIENLKKGIVPIYEPGLKELILNNKDRLYFTTNIEYTIHESDIIFIAVGTPMGEDGSADLQYVLNVAKSIGKYCVVSGSFKGKKYIVDKSTVPVGTAKLVKNTILEEYNNVMKENFSFWQRIDDKINVISNPEFLKEGSAIKDFTYPDRIIVGVDNDESREVMRELYAPLVRDNEDKLIFMDIPSAEMTKYAANAMLATKISFMNEIANICEKVGADVNLVRKGIGSDTRIGPKFLYAGCGYGGSCFPKDVKALIKTAHDNNYVPELIEKVEAVNDRQKVKLLDFIYDKFHDKAIISDMTFAIWGLSFKPNTDDMREAPSIIIMNILLHAGAKLKVYDPKAMDICKNYYFKGVKGITYCSDKYEALNCSDALLLLTEWKEFQQPDFQFMGKLLNEKVIFDGRNQYNKEELKKKGFDYYQIGVKHE